MTFYAPTLKVGEDTNFPGLRPDVPQIWAIGELRNRRSSSATSRISELTDRPEMWCRWDANMGSYFFADPQLPLT
ncbi:MAG: hypothetical protein CME06_01275 [Gemmatimonadetes bacterium]|nr:hypothetical protein [Gemmatimonadota bacterium]